VKVRLAKGLIACIFKHYYVVEQCNDELFFLKIF